MNVKVRYSSGNAAEGIKVKVGGYEGRTNRQGIVNFDISSQATRPVFVDGSKKGDYVTPADLSFTI